MEIPGLDHSIKESIVDEIIPHGLADDDINMLIKILKKYYIDDMLPLILLNNLLHYVLILISTSPWPLIAQMTFLAPIEQHRSSTDSCSRL